MCTPYFEHNSSCINSIAIRIAATESARLEMLIRPLLMPFAVLCRECPPPPVLKISPLPYYSYACSFHQQALRVTEGLKEAKYELQNAVREQENTPEDSLCRFRKSQFSPIFIILEPSMCTPCFEHNSSSTYPFSIRIAANESTHQTVHI